MFQKGFRFDSNLIAINVTVYALSMLSIRIKLPYYVETFEILEGVGGWLLVLLILPSFPFSGSTEHRWFVLEDNTCCCGLRVVDCGLLLVAIYWTSVRASAQRVPKC